MQRGTEIIEAKAKINSRSSTESNNNVPEQGATDSRRGELERGFPPSPSLQQITHTEHRQDGWLCFRAGGCCSIPGWIWGWLRDSGPFSYQLSADTKLSGGDQSSRGILLSRVPWGWGGKGSAARLPAEPALRENEKQLDALTSGAPLGPGCWHRTPGCWGSLEPGAGEPKAVRAQNTPLALRAWHTSYWGTRIWLLVVAGSSQLSEVRAHPQNTIFFA